MKNFSIQLLGLRLTLVLTCILYLSSCSEERNEVKPLKSKTSSTTNELKSTGSSYVFTPIISDADFAANGTLTIKTTTPFHEPNAATYGYRVYEWVNTSVTSTTSDFTEVYEFDPSLPGAGTPPPTTLDDNAWDHTLGKREYESYDIEVCEGLPKNCTDKIVNGKTFRSIKKDAKPVILK